MHIHKVSVFYQMVAVKDHRHLFSKQAIGLSPGTIYHRDPIARMFGAVFHRVSTISDILKYQMTLRCEALRPEGRGFREAFRQKTRPTATQITNRLATAAKNIYIDNLYERFSHLRGKYTLSLVGTKWDIRNLRGYCFPIFSVLLAFDIFCFRNKGFYGFKLIGQYGAPRDSIKYFKTII